VIDLNRYRKMLEEGFTKKEALGIINGDLTEDCIFEEAFKQAEICDVLETLERATIDGKLISLQLTALYAESDENGDNMLTEVDTTIVNSVDDDILEIIKLGVDSQYKDFYEYYNKIVKGEDDNE